MVCKKPLSTASMIPLRLLVCRATFFSLVCPWLTLSRTERGEFIVVLDSTDRENEGDLIIAAEDVTTEKMAFMIRHTRYKQKCKVHHERTLTLEQWLRVRAHASGSDEKPGFTSDGR